MYNSCIFSEYTTTKNTQCCTQRQTIYFCSSNIHRTHTFLYNYKRDDTQSYTHMKKCMVFFSKYTPHTHITRKTNKLHTTHNAARNQHTTCDKNHSKVSIIRDARSATNFWGFAARRNKTTYPSLIQ